MRRSSLVFALILVCGLVTASAEATDVHWEHGFMIVDNGNDNPWNDPGCNARVAPTWYHVIGSSNWQSYSVDLTTADPAPKYIHYIAWGGDGWDYEGYWDNLSFKLDGEEWVSNGGFTNGLKPWPHDGGGRGQFLYDTVWFDSSHGNVFHYDRSGSGADGGRNWVRLYVNQCVEDAESLVVSGDVYLLYQALPNPGWWCCAYGCAPELGNYPGEIRVMYSTECPECEASVTLCHVPPGNPANAHTITVCPESVEAHLMNHPDDHLGMCGRGGTTSQPEEVGTENRDIRSEVFGGQ